MRVPRLYIFDMGGVLCGNVHCVPSMAASLDLSPDDFFRAAGADPTAGYYSGDVRAIQDGSMGADEFWTRFETSAARLFADRRVRVPRDAEGRPEDLWGRFFRPRRDAAVASIVAELTASGYRVVCGTNTIPVHYATHRERGDYDCFQAVYASHLLGTIKPDAEFWRRVLAAENAGADETFFVDDSDVNTEAAAALDISSHPFRSPMGLRRALEELGALRS